ncbi:hypothetical protein MMC17_003725 [Xylographa soralifera]|nr:hypothetical protein [Xylographa soralifera]
MNSNSLQNPGSTNSQGSLLASRAKFSKVSSCLRRNAIHRWTTEEQVVLCIMERWFESEKPRGKRTLTYQDIRDVFVAYFADSIKFCGEVHEISANAIGAQLWEIRNDGKHSLAWREVYLETAFLDPHGCWSATRSDLLATASDIGINLSRKSTEDKVKILDNAGARLNKNKAKRKIQDNSDWDSITEYEGDTEQEDPLRALSKMTRLGLLTPNSGSKRSKFYHSLSTMSPLGSLVPSRCNDIPFYTEGNGPPTLPSTPCKSPLHKNKIGSTWTKRILSFKNDMVFRFYDSNSQGINSATGFLAGDLERTPITQPGLFSKAFLGPAENHLRRFHVPTPFISVWDSLLPALHRGLRSDAYSSGNAYVAIIDAEQLNIGHSSEYAKAIRVREIVHELKRCGRYLDMRYWGSSEYLVYREIPQSAVLTTFSIDSLREYMEARPAVEQMLRLHGIEVAARQIEYNAHLKATALPMSLFAGQTIGHFLAFIGLPQPNLELLALKMSWVWKFGSAANQERKVAYLEGVQQGYRIYYRQQGLAEPRLPVDECTNERQRGPDFADIDTFMARRQRIQQILEHWTTVEAEIEYEE